MSSRHVKAPTIFLFIHAVFWACAWMTPVRVETVEAPLAAIEITDMTSRTVRLPAPAERVMILTPTLWHYLAVEMSGDPILSLAPYMRKEIDESVLAPIFPKLASKPVMTVDRKGSAHFSVEETMAADPDLVLVWEYLSPGFEKLGIPGLVKIRSDGQDKTATYDILAKATGRKERVDWLWERFAVEMGRVEESLASEKRPQTLVVLANDNYALWSGPGFKRFDDNLPKVGGVNLAQGARPLIGPLNMETLLSLDPDVILINYYNLAQNTLTVSDVKADGRFQGLSAVKSNRVYHMPKGAMRLEGPVEEPLFVLWLGETLNPGASGLNIRQEIRRAYREVFGYSMSEDEIDDWLRFRENQDSEGGGRFDRSPSPLGPTPGGG
jgi:iron complex transport system substrate-binding protein